MDEETTKEKVKENEYSNVACCVCGDRGINARVTDKIKYNNKNTGMFYIRFKSINEKGMLCRICWQKHLQNMIDKMNGPNEKYLMKKSMGNI